ncbi:MAG TPA: hypothetical protein VJ742_13220 [Nitrososphaera sp.]|nr:hypothetical protein [Nitrososphaera sp.]
MPEKLPSLERDELIERIKAQRTAIQEPCSTCKFHVPKAALDTEGNLLKAPRTYKYNDLLGFPTCLNPRVIGHMKYGACDFATKQPLCDYYEAEVPELLEARREANVRIDLVTVRMGPGIREYNILRYPDKKPEEAEEIFKAVSNTERDAFSDVHREYASLTKDWEVIKVLPARDSFLAKVLATHAVTD